jgi:hypothetical protein
MLSVIVTAFMIAPLSTLAADTSTYTPLAPLPCISGTGSCTSAGKTVSSGSLLTTVDFKTYIQYAFNFLIAVAAVAAVFEIVWGGFEYMTTDAVNNKTEGRERVVHAVEGLLMVLCSYLILKTINPAFVNIPSTLVTPLGLASSNISADWISSLSSEIDNYHVDIKTAQDQLTTAKAQQASLDEDQQNASDDIAQMSGLSSEDLQNPDAIDTTCNDNYASDSPNSNLTDACDKYYGDEDAQINLQSSTALIVAKAAMVTKVNNCGTTGSATCYSDNKAAIAALFTDPKYTSNLQPNDLASLKNAGNAAQSTLDMDQQVNIYSQTLANYNYYEFGTGQGTAGSIFTNVARYTTSAATDYNSSNYKNAIAAQNYALNSINASLTSAKSTVTDQATYQQLVTQANTLKAQITANVPKKP